MIAILLPHEADEENVAVFADLKVVHCRRGYMALFQCRRPGDAVCIDALAQQARAAGVRRGHPDVLYHVRVDGVEVRLAYAAWCRTVWSDGRLTFTGVQPARRIKWVERKA
jgi:hypothetical protein